MLMCDPVLSVPSQKQIERIGRADLVIGIPTYRNAATVGMVAQTALDGVATDLATLRAVLINADGGSADDTCRAVADATADSTIPVVIDSYAGNVGRGSAVRAILQAALDLDARAVVVLDAHTTSITPDWIAALARPVLDRRVDLMMPRYRWPLPWGGLGDLIFYPLTRALWGRSLRQPGAGDCALSPALAGAVVKQDVWETEVAAAGFEVWLSSLALTEGPGRKATGQWHVGQVDLGEKSYLARAFPTHLSVLFREAVGTLLRQVHLRQAVWQAMPAIRQTPTFPGPLPPPAEPVSAPDPTPLVDALVVGWTEHRALWQRILTPDNLAAIESLAARPAEHFTFPADLWARVVYDFAVVYNRGERDPDRVVVSLLPLYQGRLASLWQDVAGLMPVGREGTVSAQAVEFEAAREYLLDRWQSYLPWIDSGEPR
jgi:hypothetical protein